jgi:excisionase family DNA binding protein
MATERNNEIQPQDNFPEILTVREVARFLRCSKAHVCNAIHGRVQGVTPLPAISMGRRKLVSRQSLEEWLMKNDPARCGSVL